MSEVKIFRIRGEIKKPEWKSSFRKDLRAVKQEDAIDKVYKELGSKHRVKRFQIKITSIEEITPDMTENHIIRKLSEE